MNYNLSMDTIQNRTKGEKIQTGSVLEILNPNINDNKVDGDASVDENADEQDARRITAITDILSSKKKTNNTSSPTSDGEDKICWEPGCSKEAEEYNMRHKRRGVALIFNHSEFSKMAPRRGTDKDSQDLQLQIKELGFDVKIYNNLTYKLFTSVLEATSQEDHTDADCLLVIVMTHGEPGTLFTKDLPYKEQELWKRFTGDKCVTLLGKPKLFIIQACRGDRVDPGVLIRTTVTDAVSTTYMIPKEADILLAYSTVPDYYAWRNPDKGSWYIQALCAELSVNGQKRDLLTILTFVNRRVAIDYMSNVPHNHKMDMKKQMPAFTSMLTRLVYFYDSNGKVGKKQSEKNKII